jgi:hypothetical protein
MDQEQNDNAKPQQGNLRIAVEIALIVLLGIAVYIIAQHYIDFSSVFPAEFASFARTFASTCIAIGAALLAIFFLP